MSINAQVYANYRNSSIETASPGKLLLMLYNAAIKNLEDANRAIAAHDMERCHRMLVKTQEIIVEFMCTLNMEYEISGKLLALYEYMYRRLVEANLRKDTAIIDEVRGFLVELRDTWQEAVNKAGSAAPRPGAVGRGLNIQG